MRVPAHLEHRRQRDDRSAPRYSLRLGSVVDGSDAPATIHDLSLTGLLIETSDALVTGERLLVDIPQQGLTAATVIWNSGRFFGCEFDGALPAAALSAARLRASRNVYVIDDDDARRRPLVAFNQAKGMAPWPFASVADLDQELQLTEATSAARKLAKTLSGRECEILRGLVGGLANKAIADELGLKVRTVEMHRANMMRRLNVPTLSAALRIAFYAKIAPLPLEEDRPRTIVLVPAG